jgi:CubicO group peptidase (beta-lactamase class C family)
MKPLLIAAAIALAAFAPSLATARAPASLDRDLPAVLAEHGVRSVSVARIERGRIAWAGAWGTSDGRVPATAQTLYNVASLAKPVTAETLIRAAAKGRLSLEEPMWRHWVDPDLAGDARHRLLTPRLALTHRTGLPNWRYQTKDRLAFIREPGKEVGYSGEGFDYAARFAERRTGTPFERLAERLVFAPAGMKQTAFTKRNWFEGRMALPADAEGRPVEATVRTSFSAADDLWTTASDYARFLIGVSRGQGLNASLRADREKVQGDRRESVCKPERPLTCPDESGFGLGWDVTRLGPERILWHAGHDKGEFAFAYVIPSTGEGMVILTNSAVGYKMVVPVMERAGASTRLINHLRAIVP